MTLTALKKAITDARNVKEKPSIICCKTIIVLERQICAALMIATDRR